ncbi:C10 family peptidase [Chitinophaga sp. S165]|uniref:C10 family peptidase n=1 Tax=Chitinophaga sp. S165 TaxID=2135462 RepID=UPI000D70A033|nr:C10 family peptidase [Chitinophaga sp. S165]PWV57059.1 Spi protease inhibitor [Chitinophaga sp. S165]
MKKLVFPLLLSILVVSCKKDEATLSELPGHEMSEMAAKSQSNISIEEIKEAGLNFINARQAQNPAVGNLSSSSRGPVRRAGAQKNVKNVVAHKSKDGLSTVFVVNYSPVGFTILSDNKNANPVLAFSDSGEFDINKIGFSVGLEGWVDESLTYVKERKLVSDSTSRSNNLKWALLLDKNAPAEARTTTALSYGITSTDPRMTAMNQRMAQLLEASDWSSSVIPLSAAASYLPPERLSHFKSIAQSHSSPEQYTIVEILNKNVTTQRGPLMGTHWYQQGVFGAAVPNGYAGCTAIAAGQIMNYYRYPVQFNWNNMTNSNLFVYPDISQFMYTLGQAFHMDYTPTGSGANYQDVEDALEDYGYNVVVKDHALSDVQSAINTGRPVYLRGCDGAECHAWVTEGYRQIEEAKAFRIEWQTSSYTYQTDGIQYYQPGNMYLYFYINWGWGESYNGWYSSFTNSGSNNFSSSRKNLYITRP